MIQTDCDINVFLGQMHIRISGIIQEKKTI